MAHRTLFRIENMLGRTTNLDKFKILNLYNIDFLTTMKLKINIYTWNSHKYVEITYTPYDQWVKEEIKRKF